MSGWRPPCRNTHAHDTRREVGNLGGNFDVDRVTQEGDELVGFGVDLRELVGSLGGSLRMPRLLACLDLGLDTSSFLEFRLQRRD